MLNPFSCLHTNWQRRSWQSRRWWCLRRVSWWNPGKFSWHLLYLWRSAVSMWHRTRMTLPGHHRVPINCLFDGAALEKQLKITHWWEWRALRCIPFVTNIPAGAVSAATTSKEVTLSVKWAGKRWFSICFHSQFSIPWRKMLFFPIWKQKLALFYLTKPCIVWVFGFFMDC